MSRGQGTTVILLLAAIALWTYAGFMANVRDAIIHDDQNLVKIECFLHRDNADVRRLCLDHGYDR